MSDRGGGDRDAGTLRQQIGEILGSVKGLEHRMDERRDAAREAEEGLRQEMRTVRNDGRGQAQFISNKLEQTERQLRSMERDQLDLKNQVLAVQKDVKALREPVYQLSAMRQRIIAIAALAGPIAIVTWALLEPFWRAFVEHIWK